MQSDFIQAKRLHDQGVDGNKQAVEDAYQMLKRLQQSNPHDPLIKAYYGSIITLVGRDASNNKERIRVANEGLKVLDQVVQQYPNHTDVRFLSAYVNSRIPEKYFKRTEKAIEDLEHLLHLYEKDRSIFSEDQYEDILYELSSAYKRNKQSKQAKSIKEQLLNRNPDYEKLRKKRKKEG
ncbi:hypothetical protein EDC24_1935 [Aquisalibacillus elongatus]|uniref:Tetratricopeptide repeat protein n=1 Tax=Aquisalibacillus elongatus TaxID=485577 RepID=A0A3N5C5G4_9BACI|nr:hypothetical protein EDC24_1935 [Aquisalibacillus elongatus]